MLSSIFLLTATALAGMVSAQSTPYYSTSGPLAIHASDITPGNRSAWCVSQRNECPYICGGSYASNTCDPDTLTYNCTCAGVSSQPNISNYIGTIPAFVCEAWMGFCVDGHPNDLLGQQGCHSVECGNQTVDMTSSGSGDNSSSSSSSSSSPATMSSTSTSSPTTTPTSSSSGSPATPSPSGNAAQVALSLGNSYGTGMVAAGMLAIFGLAL